MFPLARLRNPNLFSLDEWNHENVSSPIVHSSETSVESQQVNTETLTEDDLAKEDELSDGLGSEPMQARTAIITGYLNYKLPLLVRRSVV